MHRWRATHLISHHSTKASTESSLAHQNSSMILETKIKAMKTIIRLGCAKIPSLLRVTAGSCLGTTSLKSRLSSAKAGSRPRAVRMATLVHLHMVSMSFRKKNMFLQDIKQNCASNSTKTSTVHTVSVASLFIPRI